MDCIDEKRQYLKQTRISLQKQIHTERESDEIDEKITASPKKSQIEQHISSKLRSRSLHDLTIPGEDKETEQEPDPKSDKQVTRSGRVVKTPELQKQVGSLRTRLLIKEEYFV